VTDGVLQNLERCGGAFVAQYVPARPANLIECARKQGGVSVVHGFHLGMIAIEQCAFSDEPCADLIVSANSVDQERAPIFSHVRTRGRLDRV